MLKTGQFTESPQEGSSPLPPSSLRAGSYLVLWFAAPFQKLGRSSFLLRHRHAWNVLYLEIRISNCESLKRPRNSPRPTPSFCQVRKVKLKYPAHSSSGLQGLCTVCFPSRVTWRVGGLSDVTPPLSRLPQPSRDTFWVVNARVLIVTQEKALLTAALVAPHDVDAGVLAATVVLQALVHVCRGRRLSPCLCGCFTHTPSPAHSQPPPYSPPHCPAAQGLLLSRDEVPLQDLVSQKLSELKPVGLQVINSSPHRSVAPLDRPSTWTQGN